MLIILASASKRRIELLKSFGIDFKVMVSQVNEKYILSKYKDPVKAVKTLALAKAEAVISRIKAKDWLVVAADTIIFFKKEIIGKPRSKTEAREILLKLRAQRHEVLTGVALIDNQGRINKFIDKTQVYFSKYTHREIDEYLNTGVYLDRAGAYGIQDPKCDFVSHYKGSYHNILGLPTEKLLLVFKRLGINNR